MNWNELLIITKDMPVIDSELLLSGRSDIKSVRVQVSRWARAGKLIQLKRGIYLLGDTYRRHGINEYHIASVLVKPSYISFEKALEYHGLIPESVAVFTMATTKRPIQIKTPIGVFDYRHLKTTLFWGYKSVVISGNRAYVALPEKALLDYFYLHHLKPTADYLENMRLQNIEKISMKRLSTFAERYNKPGLVKVALSIRDYLSLRNDRGKKI